MPDEATQDLFESLINVQLPTFASWIQINDHATPPVATRLNVYNTFETLVLTGLLFDLGGNPVGQTLRLEVAPDQCVHYDLRGLLSPGELPMEGSFWLFSEPSSGQYALGIAALGIDFVDTSGPEERILGSVHMMHDFFNPLGIPPYSDLIASRIISLKRPDGSDRLTTFLGINQVWTFAGRFAPAQVEVRILNEAAESRSLPAPIRLPPLGGVFLDLNAAFPDMHGFFGGSGKSVAFGSLNVREVTPGRDIGVSGMVKVVNNDTGSMMIDHLFDRHFPSGLDL